jgi:hypothetical protein
MSHIPTSAVDHDDPAVQAAMKIVDGLKPAEQREIIRSAYRAAVATRRTGEPGHVTAFARNLVATVQLRGIPAYAEALEVSRTPRPCGPSLDIDEVLNRLEQP